MATPPNLVQIAFAAGIDESQQGEVLDPMSGFTLLENGRQNRRGGYSKRLGFKGLERERLYDVRPKGNRLLSYNGKACVIDGEVLDVYSESLDRSVVATRLPEVGVTSRTLVSVQNPVRLQAVHENNGYLISASFTEPSSFTGISYLQVGVETIDGVLVRAPETLEPYLWDSTNRSSDVVADICSHGRLVYVFLREPLRHDIWLWTLDTTNVDTISADWVVKGDLAGSAFMSTGDVPGKQFSVESLSSSIYLAYVRVGGKIEIKRIVDAVEVASGFVSPSVPTRSVAIRGREGDTLWVAWHEPGVGMFVQALNPTTLATTGTKAKVSDDAGNTAFLQVLPTGPASGRLFFNSASGDDKMRSVSFTIENGAVKPTSKSILNGLWLRSRVFAYGQQKYG
ncbi:MAG: hypothetical protein C4340_03210, partial [Armatimonadota bacterium]